MEHTSSPKASPGARCVSPSPSARSSVGAKRSSRPGPSRTVPSTPVRTPPAPVGDLPENELASSTLHSASIEMRPCQKGTTLKTKDGSTGSARHTPSRLQRALCKMPPVTARTVTPATVRTRPVSLSPSPKREAPSLLQTRSMEDLGSRCVHGVTPTIETPKLKTPAEKNSERKKQRARKNMRESKITQEKEWETLFPREESQAGRAHKMFHSLSEVLLVSAFLSSFLQDLFDTGFVAGTAGTQRGAASVSVRGRFQSSGFLFQSRDQPVSIPWFASTLVVHRRNEEGNPKKNGNEG